MSESPTTTVQGVSAFPARTAWRVVQAAVWVVGAALLAALVFTPDLGIHAFWNVLIPVAPALLAFAPGVWRNICPLGTTALIPRHFGFSRRREMPPARQAVLMLVGVLALFAIVPLRHVVLDLSGPATALAIAALAVVAFAMGTRFEWKSGWCSSLCPVHPVERLYGAESLVSVPNAHCDACHHCVSPCPDSTPGVHPLTARRHAAQRVAGVLLVGGFAGFIWGWFQVADRAPPEGWAHLGEAYAWPLLGALATLLVFLAARRIVPRDRERLLVLVFAALAIGCYYWYRLPMLFGFGPHPGDGMLVDLSESLPAWFPTASHVFTCALFAWWLVWRATGERPWTVRPAYAHKARGA